MPQNQINLLKPRCKSDSFSFRTRISAFISSVIAATMFIVWAVSAANTTIGNNITTSGNLTVSGASSLASLVLSSSFNASSTLQVSATSTFYSFVGLGTTSPGALLAVQGNALFSGNLNVANITATGTINITGVTTLTNASTTGMLTIGNGFISTASSTVASSLQVSGSFQASSTATLNQATISNATTTSLAVTGNASTSRLVVSNSATLNTLTGNGLFTLNSGLLSTASSTFSSNLHVSGPLSASSTLLVANLSTLTGGFISQASSTIVGNLSIAGALRGSSTATSTMQNGINLVTGCFSINGVCVGGGGSSNWTDAGAYLTPATLSDGIIISASSTVSGNFIVTGGLNASSTLTVAGNSIFYSNVGIGTTSPGALLSVQGNALFSGNLNVANIIGTGTISVTGTSGTSTIGSITFSPRGAIGIGTTTPNLANFEVATRTIAFNSGADGDLGLWTTGTNALAARYDHSSVTANGYVYVLGGNDGSDVRTNTVQYAKLNSDGSVGSWATSTNAFSARSDHSSVTANGYIYVLGGENGSGAVTNTVQYAKLNSDGSVGSWATSTNAFSARGNHSSVTANGYVYVLGGADGSGYVTNTVQYAKLNSDGSVGSWATSANTFSARQLSSSVTANGYVYVLGGADGSDGSSVRTNTAQYAKLNSDGTVGSWATSTNAFSARSDHSSVTANGYVYVLGGENGSLVVTNTAQYAKLNSDGSVGSWATSTNTFAARYVHSSVTANGYVYVLGGIDSGSARTNTVQYASTARILVSGNLDLLGLASTTLGDVNSSDFGSVGGSIFAGNIFSAGQLEVTGNANFWNGMGINGVFSLRASTSLAQDVPIFSIQNATGTSPILTALYNGNVGIGTTSPGALLAVQGNALFSGNLNVANITATGTLNVTGVTTLTNASTTGMLTIGNGFISQASSTVSGNFIVSGGLNASSTLTVAGKSIFYNNVGIGTTSPGALLSVQGNALFSGNLNVANIIGTGTISVTGTSGTSTIGSITFSPRGAIGIGTTTPNLANFEVATRTIAFNSGADGNLGSWATSANTFAVREYHSSVTANGYVYVLGGIDGISDTTNTVQYAKLNSDGTVGSWATSTNTFAARTRHSSVTANGYVYVLGGLDGIGVTTNTAQYAKLNSDGTVGPWTTSTNTFSARTFHSSVTANGYVYVLGGADGSGYKTNTVQYAKLNSDGTVGTWATNTNSFAARDEHSSVTANGYVYVLGGMNGGPVVTNTAQYAKLNSDGTVGPWATSTNTFAVRFYHSSVTANGYVYVLGGQNGSLAKTNTAQYAKLNSDGTVGSWATSTNTFAARERHSSVTANGYVYVLGGREGSDPTNTAQYASTARILVSGNLDLLGLASTTLGDVNSSDFGSVGSSIFAGNIFSAGQLEVTGNALFSNGVGINGTLSVNATTSGVQNIPIFSIQNATGTSPIMTALYNGNVGIGTTSPTSKLSIEGTCIDTGAGCADYAELYTSSEPVEPGDVLVFDQDYAGQVRKAQTGDTALIGAVSTNPAIIIEGSALQLMSGVNYKSNPTKPAVALAGKIPVKVNLEGGDINIGDPITISSIPGIGQKAAESGKIIGYALENLSQASTTAEAKDKIMMFVSLGYWLGPDILNATSTNSSLALSQSNGLLAQVVDTVKAWLESMKIFVEDGIVRLKNLVAEKITAQKAVLDEIELKDEVTRDIYCVRINNGALLTTPGECGSNIDTEPPIITLIGESAITIEKGISWADPGATVTDNVNDNLGIYYKVDGVETGNGGRDLPQTAIDTNIIGNHTITYTSTDSAGNIGTATRTVNIVDPVGYSN